MKSLRAAHKGFTLIELMISVAIIGILAAIAMPNYTEYVKKGNRRAAQSQMMEIANLEQQFLLADRTYANKAALVASGYTSPAQVSKYNYDITVDNAATPPSFTITFTATGSQVSDGDLTLNNAGVKTPAGKW